MKDYNFKKITPFKWFVLQNFPFIDEDLDAITNYQLFCKLGEEINKVIESQNLAGEQVETLTNAFNELQNFISNYFENLDVQDEINNKLDEMAESGQLQEIIQEYIDFSRNSYIIEEITTEKIYVENNKGNVFITHIPHKNNKNEIIPIKHGFANDQIDHGVETATNFSNRNKTTLTINASIFFEDTTAQHNKGELAGLYIHNGLVIKDNRNILDETFLKNRWILGFKNDNTMKAYIGNTSVQDIVGDDIVETVQAFIPILVDGQDYYNNLVSSGSTYWTQPTFTATEDEEPNYDKIYYTYENSKYIGHFHLDNFITGATYYEPVLTNDNVQPRQVICQMANKDIYIITNNGRGKSSNIGLTINDFLTLAQWLECEFAFILDGGGSATTVYKNIMLNNAIDDKTNYSARTDGTGYTIREIPDFLYFSKETQTETDLNINYILNQIQELNKKVNDLILTTNEKFYNPVNIFGDENQQHWFKMNNYNPNTKEFENSMNVYFNNRTTFPGGLSIEDVQDNINHVFRLYSTRDKFMEYLDTKLAFIPDVAETIPNNQEFDLNNINPVTRLVYLDRRADRPNQPFVEGEGNIYLLYQFGHNTYRCQVAISLKSLPVLRVRVKTDSGWAPWRNIAVTALS